ncbi:hypothetical protein D3C85_1690350 [compost metagenome]
MFVDHKYRIRYRVEDPAQGVDALLCVMLHTQFLADITDAAPHAQQAAIMDGGADVILYVSGGAVMTAIDREGAIDIEVRFY